MLAQLDPAHEGRLIERLLEGDEDAFLELYRCYLPSISAYLLGKASRPKDAEDIAQDVFIKVAELRRFDYGDETSFRRWLFTVARSQLNNFYRKDRRHNGNFTLNDELGILTDGLPPMASADLHMVIQRLESPRREVLGLHLNQLTNREIATELGLHESTVSYHMKRAIDDLKNILDDDVEP